jgi:hypothetical protein
MKLDTPYGKEVSKKNNAVLEKRELQKKRRKDDGN